MSQGLCPSCGAAVKLTAEQTDTKCTYCDSVVTLQQAEAQASEVKQSKFAGTLMIAETAQEGGNYAEAINYFNKVIEQEPSFADAWLNKGICMVYTSKIGDLKIPEAVSSWKAAIKFAKNPEAMKKRVALEINNAVSDFYPVLEQHYRRFHDQDDSLQEHGSRFVLLESALSLALELSPSATIAKNGVSLCDLFIKSIKAAAASDKHEATMKFLGNDADTAAGSAQWKIGELKEKVASEWKARLVLTRRNYEEVYARFDPEFAKEFAARLTHEQQEAAKRVEQAAKEAEKKAQAEKDAPFGCAILGLLPFAFFSYAAYVRASKAWGDMETTVERSEHEGPALAYTCLAVATLIGILWGVREGYKRKASTKN